MWLEVARSSNLPEYPAMYYVEAVKDLGGCPVEVVTDLGTENGLLTSTDRGLVIILFQEPIIMVDKFFSGFRCRRQNWHHF